jgi:hypothetical protein
MPGGRCHGVHSRIPQDRASAHTCVRRTLERVNVARGGLDFREAAADEMRMDDVELRSPAPLTWLAVSCAAAAAAAGAHVGADARWLAVVGGTIVRLRALPHSIAYAAAPSSWHDAPALGQIVFHGLERAFGDRGLVLAQAAALACAAGALAVDMRRRGAGDAAGAAVLVALVVAAPGTFLVVRAELYSLALFPLLLLVLRRETGRRNVRVWLAIPLLTLWANLHGGVLVGFAAFAAYLLFDRLRRAPLESAALLGAGAAALFATPALLHSASYYEGVLRGEAAAEHYGLWAPLSLREPLDIVLVAVAVPLVALALRARPRAWELAVLAGTAAATVEAHRDGIWLLLAAAPLAARGLGGGSYTSSPLVRRAALAGLVLPAVCLVSTFARPPAADGAGERLLAVAVASSGGGPILADPLDAEKLAQRGARVWIGNPIDAFARVEQRRYLAWLRGEPSGDSIAGGRVRIAVVTIASKPQRRLAARAGFREIARDARAVVYAAR